MNILLINNDSLYIENLTKLLSKYKLKVIIPEQINKTKIESYDLIVLSGGHGKSVYGNENFYSNEISFVKNTQKPIIGICLGMEIILAAYNQNIQYTKVNIKGEDILEVVESSSIFENIDITNLKIFENHKWFVGNVTEDLHSLARCRHCIQIVKATNKQIYGFQYHPEVLIEGSEESKIIENLLEQFRVNLK